MSAQAVLAPPAVPLLSRFVLTSYLVALALLPWSWFPPFPWLHEHAQWSDIIFAITTLAWGWEKRRTGFPFQAWHLATVLYLTASAGSLLFAAPDKLLGTMKWIGMVELGLLAVITADVAGRPKVGTAITVVMTANVWLITAAVLLGLVLFYSGIPTRLVGTYGDLLPSPWYARMQAGTIQPNMLASFCIFTAALIARGEDALPAWLRRLTKVALWMTVLLTFSRGILAFALAAALRQSRTPKQRWGIGIAVAGCLVLLALLTIGNLSFNPARPTAVHWKRSQPSSRWEAMTTAWQTLQTHPLWGSGIGREPGMRHGRTFDAHCTPLNVAATLGLPALLAFGAIFFCVWRGRPRPTDIALWSGLVGMGLESLAHDVEDFRHLWVLLGGAAMRPSAEKASNAEVC